MRGFASWPIKWYHFFSMQAVEAMNDAVETENKVSDKI